MTASSNSALKGQQLKALLPVLILVGGAVAGACVLAGEAAALALSRFALDGGMVLAWAAAAAGIGCWPVRWLGGPSSRATSLTLAMSLGIGWGILSILVLLLGLAGILGPGVSWCLVGIGVVAGAVAIRGQTVGNGLDAEESPAEAKGSWAILALLPLLAMALFLALIPPGFLWRGEPNGYDVLAYHFQLPREWWELGRIVPLHHNVFSFFPLGMEMHYLLGFGLAGGPFAGVYVAQMMHLAFFAAAGLGIYGALLPHGRTPALAATLALLAAPHCLLTAPIGYNEGVQVLYGVLLVALCLEAPTVVSAALAGLCVGFAVGGKLTAVPLWGLVPVLAIILGRGAAGRIKLKSLAVYAIAAALSMSPWLIRTALWSHGNPVFPVAANVFGKGHFTDEQVDRFNRAHSPRPDQQSVGARLHAFSDQVLTAPEFGWVIVPAGLVAGALLLARRNPAAVWLLAGLAVQTGVWLFATHLQSRFFIPALPLVAVLVGLAAATSRPAAGGAAIVFFLVSLFAVGLAWSRLSYLRDAKGQFITAVLGADYVALQKSIKPPELSDVPADLTLNLVGDGKAFGYTRPMARLKYTSVFDAVGPDVKTAWRVEPGEALWVDPGELQRFADTAYHTPPPPPEWKRPEPFLILP